MNDCPCGSNMPYPECCGALIAGEKTADTAEQVMRARYSAHVMKELDYIRTSLHPDHRSDYDEKSSRAWAERAQWHGLAIQKTTGGGPDDHDGQVEFIASFTENGVKQEHRELSDFRKKGGIWYLVSGKALPPLPVVRTAPKAGRNEPCPCGSEKKFKKCCG